MTQNVSFNFWPFPTFFVLLKLTCLVTLFDRKLQVFKNSPNWTVLAFWINLCPLKMQMRLFMWFLNTVFLLHLFEFSRVLNVKDRLTIYLSLWDYRWTASAQEEVNQWDPQRIVMSKLFSLIVLTTCWIPSQLTAQRVKFPNRWSLGKPSKRSWNALMVNKGAS